MPPKLTINYVRKAFELEGYRLITEDYTHSSDKNLTYVCPNSHIHTTTWLNWYNGKRCPMCAPNARTDIGVIRDALTKEGYKLLSTVYINNRTKFKYKCPKGHTGFITWDHWNRRGIRCLICSNIAMSEKVVGDKHPNWKGGITCEPYCQEWTKEFKEYVKERDGFICLNPYCYKRSNRLCVHHINYNKKDCRLNNLITVCSSCNIMANKDRDWHMFWYKAILSRRYGYD